MDKVRLGISECLLGHEVRYDGSHKLDRFLTDTLGTICGIRPGLSRSRMRVAGTTGAYAAGGKT